MYSLKRLTVPGEALIVALVAIACYLPFINKPLTIDADMLVHTARQMLIDPIDPPLGAYGRLMVLHDHTAMPRESVYYRTGHPPLLPLLLAPVVAAAGTREWPLHLALFVFYAAAIVAVWYLLGLFYQNGWRFWGTLIWIVSPVFLLNGSNVMWDVPITAFMLGSFVLLLAGLRHDDIRLILLSGLAAGLGALTKVNILPLFVMVPLFLVATRRWSFFVAWTAPAAALPLLWVAHNLVVYGQIHYLSVGWYSFLFGDIRYRMERNLSFFGAALVLPMFWLWLMVALRQWRPLAAVMAAGVFWGALLVVVLEKPLLYGGAYALCAAAGLWMLYRSLLFVRGPKRGSYQSHEPLLISVYALLYLVVLNIMPSASMRYILPLMPLGLLVIGDDLAALSRAHRRVFCAAAVVVGAVVSLGCAIGDYIQGSADRALPARLSDRGYAPESTWYYGRVSYAWYLHHAGFRNLRGDTASPAAGDALVNEALPGDYDARLLLGGGFSVEPIDTIDAPWWPLRVAGFGAGFYGHDRLPWSVHPTAPQKRVVVYRIRDGAPSVQLQLP